MRVQPISPIVIHAGRVCSDTILDSGMCARSASSPWSYRAPSSMVQTSLGRIEESGSQFAPALLRSVLMGPAWASPIPLAGRCEAQRAVRPSAVAGSVRVLSASDRPSIDGAEVATTTGGQPAIIKVRQMSKIPAAIEVLNIPLDERR